MRSASGARVGDGGGTGGLGGGPTDVEAPMWNGTAAGVGAVATAWAAVRPATSPATMASGPASQQLSQVLLSRAAEGGSALVTPASGAPGVEGA